MCIETSAELNAWIFQQREAFKRFFGEKSQGNALHLSHLIRSDIQFLGENGRKHAYLWKNHYRKSWVAELLFCVAGEDRILLVPAPRDDGVFEVNGNFYTAPFQRLWVFAEKKGVEYRRIDQVLHDGLIRRHDDEDVGEDQVVEPTSQDEGEYDSLAFYLRQVLNPVRNPERLLSPLEADQNAWGRLARQTQVKTIVAEGADKDMAWEPGRTPYRRVYESELLGETARQNPEEGLDAFHTPEGKKIGLTRYLTLGTTIDDDRMLHPGAADSCGLMASCVPFAQLDDGRRVLMACGMMGRAIRAENAEAPRVQTSTERRLREGVSQVAEENIGVNLRVGFMFWEGLNFEDSIVVSQSAAEKLHVVESRVLSVPVPCFCTAEPIHRGQVKKGDRIITFRYSPVRLGLMMPAKLPEAGRGVAGLFPLEREWMGTDASCPCDGEIENVKTVDLWSEDCPGAVRYSQRIDISIRIDRPLEVGDKLCNRHGNKGVVSRIVPDEEMPHHDGKHLEVLLNPIGIINRGNYGQLLEALTDHLPDLSSDIVPNPEARMRSVLDKAGDSRLPYSKVSVPGRTTEVHAIVGTNYILRMPHHASEALNVCQDGDYLFSSITEQPRKGMGQKYGEMEIAALQAHGAEAILKELCIERSRGKDGSKRVRPGPQRPLVEWIRAVGLDLKCDGSDATICPQNKRAVPPGKDLFDASVKCMGDPACNVREKEDEKAECIRLATLHRRLCSEPFFDECGSVYLDLGKTLCFDVQKPSEKKWSLRFKSQYLPILHPRCRPALPQGGASKTTKYLQNLIHALWKLQKDKESGSDEEVIKQCKYLLRHLVAEMSDKNGIIRRVGLCRRLSWSARMAIVPDPLLPVDCVSLPWDAVRMLFEKHLSGADLVPESLRKSQYQIHRILHEEYKPRIDEALRSEWVLLNRAPTLHKYNIMAFHPRVHFDTRALRIPLLATTPFAADFDGDEMSVVPLFSEDAKREAASLSIPHNLESVADGSVIPKFTKDLLLGLHLYINSEPPKDELNHELKALGFLPLPSEGKAESVIEAWISKWTKPYHGRGFPEALQLVVEHSLRALRAHQNQSCFGSLNVMGEFHGELRISKAAKDEKLWKAGERGEDASLLDGLTPPAMRAQAIERIRIMVLGKLSVGDYGGYMRRLYYRIRGNETGGVAFKDEMQKALVTIQSLAERATQCVLSSKSGTGQLDFDDFEKSIEDMISNQKMPAGTIQKHLGFEPERLEHHAKVLKGQVLSKNDYASDLLSFLRNQFKVPFGSGLSGSTKDPRIGIFLA